MSHYHGLSDDEETLAKYCWTVFECSVLISNLGEACPEELKSVFTDALDSLNSKIESLERILHE